MGKIADLSTLNPIYEYLPYCATFRDEIDPTTHKKTVVTEYRKTYPPFPWKRDGNAHESESPVEFIEECARQGLVRWETKEQELERIRREEEQGYVRKPVSWEEYQKLTGNRGDAGNDES